MCLKYIYISLDPAHNFLGLFFNVSSEICIALLHDENVGSLDLVLSNVPELVKIIVLDSFQLNYITNKKTS